MSGNLGNNEGISKIILCVLGQTSATSYQIRVTCEVSCPGILVLVSETLSLATGRLLFPNTVPQSAAHSKHSL